MKDDRSVVVDAWIKKAENDLITAEHTMKMNHPPTDTICFHAQQCAEKYIKGLLVHLQVHFPKTHSLEDLADLCEEKLKGISDEFGDLVELTSYGVWVRYPDDEYYDIPEDDAENALLIAKKVKQVVLKYIGKNNI